MKIIIRNCDIELQNSGLFHQVITDSFSEYFKEGYALKNTGEVIATSGFNTFDKIPVPKECPIIISETYAVSGIYSGVVVLNSDMSIKETIQKVTRDTCLTYNEDVYISICCSDRTKFSMYTPNVYDTINSDLYIQNNKVLKNDGTLQSFNDFYVINKIPVSVGDNLLFSLNLVEAVQSSYAAYCFMDSNSVVYDFSYKEAIIEDKIVTVKEDGFFSCCCRRNPFNMFADIIQD